MTYMVNKSMNTLEILLLRILSPPSHGRMLYENCLPKSSARFWETLPYAPDPGLSIIAISISSSQNSIDCCLMAPSKDPPVTM